MLVAIVKWDSAHGWAGMSGAEPLSSIAKDATHQEIAFINHGYGEPLGYRVRPILDAQGASGRW